MILKYLRSCFLLLSIFIFSCSSNDSYTPAEPTSPVVFDINTVPYATLSEYNFFDGDIKNLSPVYGVIPYEPISGLFTDYAHKQRLIWMPDDVEATYVDDHSILNFPTGTVLIKSFYYDNVQPNNDRRIIETRLMIKKDTEWVFANYIWNNDQTQAVLNLDGGFTDIEWIDEGVTKSTNYKIPAESECFTCHKKAEVAIPIGPKPQNLNRDFTFSDGTANQLDKLQEMGYLNSSNLPANINSVVDWEDESQSLDLRVRSYIDMNCAHCHSDLRHCDYRPIRLAYNESGDDTNLGVCVDPDEAISPYVKIVLPGNYQKSMLHFRLGTTQEEYMMPLIGRTLVHEEALQLIEQWIESLTDPCP